jgi:hypothetical protein
MMIGAAAKIAYGAVSQSAPDVNKGGLKRRNI